MAFSKYPSRSSVLSLGPVAIALLAATAHGCADDEGNFIDPAGFSPQHTRAVALTGAHFTRDSHQQLLSSRVLARRATRSARGLAPDATLDEPSERLHLETTFHGSYADGMTVAAATHPRASLKVVPVGAQKAPSRLRNDGAVVAFEDAFPHVTSAFGGRESKVEEFLVIPSEKDIPTLAYDLEPGPEFGHLEQDEEGKIWAYAQDGAGLFVMQPPYADDAEGKHVAGSWKLSEKEGGGYRVVAELELKGLAYPVMVDPTFETPDWFKNATGSSFVARASAAGTFDPAHNCSVVFGGGTTDVATFTPSNTLHIRCSDRVWKTVVNDSPSPTVTPQPRYTASLGYFGGTTQKIFLFAGSSGTIGVANDLWKGSLSLVGSVWHVTWTQVAPLPAPAPYPSPRIRAGMAWDGTNLLMFGGVAPSGAGLTDTWAYNGDTNTWTLLDSDSFYPTKGNYGFGFTTIPTPTGREVYASAGYYDPSASSYQAFLNSVTHWTGSGWEDVTGAPRSIWSQPSGVLSSVGSDAMPAKRYLHWMAATGNDRFLMGSGQYGDAAGNRYDLSDTWSWSTDPDLGPVWTRQPVPSTTNYFPGFRADATAIYDENLKEMVLVGGDDSSAGTFVPQAAPRVYRAQKRSFTFEQYCDDVNADGICDNDRPLLKVTFDMSTTSSSPDPVTPQCSDLQPQFLGLAGSGTWSQLAAPPASPSTTSPCTYVLRVPASATQWTNYGVRVRDKRFTPTSGTSTAACQPGGSEMTGTTTVRGACLASGAYVGSATCGEALNTFSSYTSIPCANY